MGRPNWLRFFVTQLVVFSWQPFPVRTERQSVGVFQDAGVPLPGPADTLNSDCSSARMAVMTACLHKQSAQNRRRSRIIFGRATRAWIGLMTCYLQPAPYPPPWKSL
ncbi:hypothetical protein HPB50_015561 [Hyalomma asiaticum]|uniref:Uncharacterized protein n=1 Tax=Hyalomma asiaticum TaxID=266040 RepID=A0ACB7RL46_HYAAI|nr:hypothetical protein HPB50_015561 [Hyalomma asiaticum]